MTWGEGFGLGIDTLLATKRTMDDITRDVKAVRRNAKGHN
jgi:hypothetical protein